MKEVMKKALREVLICLVPVALLCGSVMLAGCVDQGTHYTQGFFYINPVADGYVVLIRQGENQGGKAVYVVTKPMRLDEAHALCDQLNKDLGDKAL